jgi:hypothetical protein
MFLCVRPEDRKASGRTIRIRSEVKRINGEANIQIGPYALYLWSNSRRVFPVKFYLAVHLTCRSEADALASSACFMVLPKMADRPLRRWSGLASILGCVRQSSPYS